MLPRPAGEAVGAPPLLRGTLPRASRARSIGASAPDPKSARPAARSRQRRSTGVVAAGQYFASSVSMRR